MKVVAIVPAAGSSKRMGVKPRGGHAPLWGASKLFLKLNGAPILAMTVGNLSRSKMISSIILVVNKRDQKKARALIQKYCFWKVKDVVIGGKEREDSVRNGLLMLNKKEALVLIHDGARPFVDTSVISRTVKTAQKYGAAIAGVPEKSTIKRLTQDGFVFSTLKRDELWEIQTPQVFKRDLILKAYNTNQHKLHTNRHESFRKIRGNSCAIRANSCTDDSTLIEMLGHRVKVVLGSYKNIKITTPEDLVFAKALLNG